MKKEKSLFERIVIDTTTIADGKNFCYAKIHGWIAFFIGSGLQASSLKTFDYKEFCEGTAVLIGAVGAAIYMKKKDEPEEKTE